MRGAAAALVVLLGAARALAAPVPIADDEARFELDLPGGWDAAEPPGPEGGRVLASFASGPRRLVVARLRGNTDGAYDARDRFFAGLEEGVRRATPGYRRLGGTARTVGKKRPLPVYDLWYATDDGVRGVRFVFPRGRGLVATLSLPGERAAGREARRLLESFRPR